MELIFRNGKGSLDFGYCTALAKLGHFLELEHLQLCYKTAGRFSQEDVGCKGCYFLAFIRTIQCRFSSLMGKCSKIATTHTVTQV